MPNDSARLPQRSQGRGPWLACLAAMGIAAFLAYSNSFSVPFLFDDLPSIEENLSIRSLWPPWGALRPPWGNILAGRPVFNLTLAANHAASGLNVFGFHVVNLLIHLAAAWVLFGLVRRTLQTGPMREAFGEDSLWLALFCALLWMLHPLQTSSVTYLCGRNEALLGLCYLATLYGAARAGASSRPWTWRLVSGLAFVLGAGVKEVIVTAPLIVFFYERVFLRAGLEKKRKPLHALAPYAVYVPGFLAMAILLSIGGSAGFVGRPPFSRWEYVITQPVVIGHYIRLAFWPTGLCLDYNWPVATLGESSGYILGLSALFFGSAWALWRRNPLGFLGAWFFFILAPSSSFMPLRDLAFEYRLYLPLASLVCLVVAGGYWTAKRISGASGPRWRVFRAAGALTLAAAALALGLVAFDRNRDYASETAIWSDTRQKQPGSPRARLNLGSALAKAGKWEKAVACFRQAIAMEPDYVTAHYNLGCALANMGRHQEAIASFYKVLSSPEGRQGDIGPYRNVVRLNLASSLAATGNIPEAVAQCEKLAAIPSYAAVALFDLGHIQASSGRFLEAAETYRRLLRLQPDHAAARANLGVCLAALGQPDEAIRLFQEAAALDPGNAFALQKLADSLAAQGRFREAILPYQDLLRLQPACVQARVNLGVCLARMGRPQEAVAHWKEALRIDPSCPGAGKYLKAVGAGQG